MRTSQIVKNTSPIPPRPTPTPKTNPASSVPERLAPERLAPERLAPERLAPSTWLRVVAGFDKPFGQDGLPTIWG